VAFRVNHYEKAAWTFNSLIPETFCPDLHLHGRTDTKYLRGDSSPDLDKANKPLDAEAMTTVTARSPAWLILRLDEEAAKLARSTGVQTINRSDMLRKLLVDALTPKGGDHAVRE
jgi:hypothetical protein